MEALLAHARSSADARLALAAAAAAVLTPLAVALLAGWRPAALFGPRRPELSRDWQRFPVVGRLVANPHSARPVVFLTLGVSTESLPTGAHVKVRRPAGVFVGGAGGGGAECIRSYTPTRFDRGQCELMFRVYEGGPMSTYLASARVGDFVEMMGPTGLERYAPEGVPGTFSHGPARQWAGITHIAMVAGGTGITPMLQIANAVLQGHPRGDVTLLSLIAFSTGLDDILLEGQLQALAAGSKGQLRLTFAASGASDAQLAARPGPRDAVRASMRSLSAAQLAELLNAPADECTMVCVCGPRGFCTQAVTLLEEAGYPNVLFW